MNPKNEKFLTFETGGSTLKIFVSKTLKKNVAKEKGIHVK